MTAEPSANRLAARVVAVHAGGSPRDRHEVLEMLGIVDGPTGRDILPDDTSPARLSDMGKAPGKAGDEPPLRRAPDEPPPRNVTTPPGLRVLPPLPTAAPARRKAPAKRQSELDAAIARHPAGRAPISPADPVATEVDRLVGVGVSPDVAATIAPAGARHRPHLDDRHTTGRASDVSPPAREVSEPSGSSQSNRRSVPRLISTDLDAWFTTAGQSPDAVVRRAARRATAELGLLRLAMNDLARTERTAATRLAGGAQ